MTIEKRNKGKLMAETNEIVKPVKKRKAWFRLLKQIMKMRYKRPAFVYLGEKFKNSSVILSNHEGTDSPMSLEIYNNDPLRMWGTAEMNSGLKRMYKYQSRVYFHEKKGWSLFGARMFCLIASPLTNMFYSGFDLISTYQDARFLKTIRESEEAIKKGQSVVIFPENSTNGYLEELEGFHPGYLLLLETLHKKGIDVPVYVTYFRKKDKVYVIDKPVMYSELLKKHKTREEISKELCVRCNELGKMEFEKEFLEELKKQQKEENKKK